MQSIKKTTATIVHTTLALAMAFSFANCAGKEKKPDNTPVPIYGDDAKTQKIGEVIPDGDKATAMMDRDGNNVAEEKIKMVRDGENMKVDRVFFDKDQDGKDDSVVIYEGGKPAEVIVYNVVSEVRGKAVLADEKTVKYVDIPAENKRVHFAADGSVSEITAIP